MNIAGEDDEINEGDRLGILGGYEVMKEKDDGNLVSRRKLRFLRSLCRGREPQYFLAHIFFLLLPVLYKSSTHAARRIGEGIACVLRSARTKMLVQFRIVALIRSASKSFCSERHNFSSQ